MNDLRLRLKKLREDAGMSQQQLATKAGVSISVVSQLEQGKKTDPRLSTAVALADALGVTVDDLVRHRPHGKPTKN